MADTWVNPELSIGKVAYDMTTKELVLIANGRCAKPHDSSDAYRRSHADGKGCLMEPYEGLAIRVEPFGDAYSACAVYVGVAGHKLNPISEDRAVTFRKLLLKVRQGEIQVTCRDKK